MRNVAVQALGANKYICSCLCSSLGIMSAKKFDIAKAASIKREADQNSQAKKIPKIADMKIEAPRQVTQRVTTNGPLNICVYPVTEQAGDLWALYKGSPTIVKIWQVQVDHDARPSVTVKMLDNFNEYLKEAARSTPGVPESVQKLQENGGIKLVLTNKDDSDNVCCFVQYRVAWYIAGETIDVVVNWPRT